MAQRSKKRKKTLLLRPEWCKGCNICVEFCPTHVLALDADMKVVIVDDEACTECGLCEMRCPDFAIELVPLPEEAR